MQLEKAEREGINALWSRFSERIGSTVYRVSVYFPKIEDETLEAKILRLTKNDLISESGRSMMDSLQTGWLRSM
jgi:hypothetical protein